MNIATAKRVIPCTKKLGGHKGSRTRLGPSIEEFPPEIFIIACRFIPIAVLHYMTW